MQPWGWHHQHVSVPWRSIPGAPRLSYTAAVQLKKQANTNGSRGALCCLLANPLPSYLAHTEAFVTTSLLSIITLGRNNRKWLKKKKAPYSHLNHLDRVAISVTASKGVEYRCVHSNASDLWTCFSGHQAITNQEILKGRKENDLNSKHVNIISSFSPLRVRIQGIFPFSGGAFWIYCHPIHFNYGVRACAIMRADC